MSDLTNGQRRYLLSLARRSIERHLASDRALDIEPAEVPDRTLLEKRACFVTLHLRADDTLRGCIGSLQAHRPLVLDVAHNAISAAFDDPRFPPVTGGELSGIRISISVLSAPRPFKAGTCDEVLDGLIAGKHGLIIQEGRRKATFLPAVWSIIPDKEVFLSELCLKAGLSPERWRKPSGLSLSIYEAEEFAEG